MKLDAVEVTSKDLKKTTEFYALLGFIFPPFTDEDKHVEALNSGDMARLMIDHESVMKEMLGEDPHPGNHSSFAIQYESPAEVDEIILKVKAAGHTIVKEPWDAVWAQHYAIVADPDGYRVDLYASL